MMDAIALACCDGTITVAHAVLFAIVVATLEAGGVIVSLELAQDHFSNPPRRYERVAVMTVGFLLGFVALLLVLAIWWMAKFPLYQSGGVAI